MQPLTQDYTRNADQMNGLRTLHPGRKVHGCLLRHIGSQHHTLFRTWLRLETSCKADASALLEKTFNTGAHLAARCLDYTFVYVRCPL